jgi:multicomponent Na+:H+ antiporter subunit D
MILAMAIPALASALVVAAGRWPNLREGISTLATLLTFGAVCMLWPHAKSAQPETLSVIEVFPGVPIAFQLEPLGMLFALVASGLWIVTSLYAIGYMRAHEEENQTRFFACFALAIFAALGIAFAKNLFTLFLFYEVLTFSTYPLVTHHGTPEAKRAGRIYLGILVFTSVFGLLFGVLWTYSLAGTLDFQLGGILGDAPPSVLPWLLALFAFGTGKAALMPFHRWLPNAMVAPTPVSALLHAVAVVKAGVFTVLKVVIYVFGLDLLSTTGASQWLMAVAAFTMVASSVKALTLDNLKARLAYSTISQLAYIVLAAALATGMSVLGGGMHIAMHAVGKITLFFCAGAIYVASHKKYVSQLNGIGYRMPWTMGAFFLASLSIIGIPPMGGSWSKWFMGLGAIDGGNGLYVAVYMLSSLLSIGYLMPVLVNAWFKREEHHDHGHSDHHDHGEASPLMVVPLCFTAAGCVALFFGADGLYRLLLPLAGGAL